MSPMGWSVIVPVRSGGKSRLHAPGDWSRACALDTLAALENSALVQSILIVGDLEHHLPQTPDLGAGLNEEVARASKEVTLPLAIVLGDLPSLTSDDVDSVLRMAEGCDLSMVMDRQGSGTTMLMARHRNFTPLFGINSAQRHTESGFVSLDAPERARCDVDTYEDLVHAAALGLGKETRALFQTTSSAQ